MHRLLAKQPNDRFAFPHEVTSSIAPFTVGQNLAQLVATDSPPVADPELASTFHHASSAEIGTGSNLDCGDLSPLSVAAQPLSAPKLQSGSAASQSGDKSPHSKWRRLVAALVFGGAAVVVLCGIVIIIRDEKGNEKARLKLDKKDKIEIVQDDHDSKLATPTADAATPKKIVIGPLVPRPPMVPLDLKPLPIDIKPGSPMSPCALVARPASLDGVLSWTIELRQPRGYTLGLAYNPDGTLFASGGSDHVVRIWDAKTYALLKVLAGGSTEAAIHSVNWSPDGKYLAAGFTDGVRIWEAKSGQLMKHLQPKEGWQYCNSMRWSPDGKWIAAGGSSNHVALWDATDRWRLRWLKGHSGQVDALAWSPDAKQLASGCIDKTVRIWDVASDESRRTLEPHDAWIRWLDWSPDGLMLVSSEYDKRSRIWNVVTGGLLDVLPDIPVAHSACR